MKTRYFMYYCSLRLSWAMPSEWYLIGVNQMHIKTLRINQFDFVINTCKIRGIDLFAVS